MKKSSLIITGSTLGIMLMIIATITLSAKYFGNKDLDQASPEPNLLGLSTSDAALGLPRGISLPTSSDQGQTQITQQRQPSAKPAQSKPATELVATDSADKKHARVIQVTLTNDQSFKIALYPDIAPITVANFLQNVQAHFYDGLIVFRVEKDQLGNTVLIQTGDPRNDGTGGGAIQAEYNKKPFLAGSIGIARGQNRDLNSSSQFFIMTQPLPSLDGNYTNFGDVIEGLDVIAAIQKGQTIKTITILN